MPAALSLPLTFFLEEPALMRQDFCRARSVCLKCINDACHKVVGKSVKLQSGAGVMAQWLRAPTALLKVLSSNPSNRMVAHIHP